MVWICLGDRKDDIFRLRIESIVSNSFRLLKQKEIVMILRKIIGSLGILGLLLLIFNNVQSQDKKITSDKEVYGYLDPKGFPPQSPKESVYFIDDLKVSMLIRQPWSNTRLSNEEVDISEGVTIRVNFSDQKNRLETAYNDLIDFLASRDVNTKDGKYIIETAYTEGLEDEAFQLEINRQSCRILASGAGGIRRGIFYIEDEQIIPMTWDC